MSEIKESNNNSQKGGKSKKTVKLIIGIPVLLIVIIALYGMLIGSYEKSVTKKVDALLKENNYVATAEYVSKADAKMKTMTFGKRKWVSDMQTAFVYAQAASENPSYVGELENMASQNASYAPVMLFVCYAQGKGVAQDMQKAKEWYNKAIAMNRYYNKEDVDNLLSSFGIDTTAFAE